MITDLEYAKGQLLLAMMPGRPLSSVVDCAQRALDAVERALAEAHNLGVESDSDAYRGHALEGGS